MDRGGCDRRVGPGPDHRRVAVRAIQEPHGEHVRRPHARDDAQPVRGPRRSHRCEGRSVTQVSGAAPNPLAERLHDYRVGEPCLMVIFGATGDLSARKLLPALYNLAKQRLLPAGFAVVGAAIDDLTDESFRAKAAEKIKEFSRTQPIDQRVLDAFLSECFYVKVDFGKLDDFKNLQRRLVDLDTTRHVPGNRMFYCATPPPTYETIVEQIKAAGLKSGEGFHRIVVEKPFGSDLKSARELTQ